MDARHLIVERRDGVVLCTLTNPPRNFMNATMVGELDALTREVADRAEDRVLVLTGGVPGIFITHYDVGEIVSVAERTDTPRSEELSFIHRVFNRLESMEAITIAALNGDAMGGGCELSLACDFRLMAEGPFRYGLPETSVGIIPGAGGTQRLARLLGTPQALDLILHARILDPKEAHAMGLVHRLLPTEDFLEGALRFAAELARRAPIALAAAKEAIRRGAEQSLEEGLAIEQRAFAKTLRTEDARGAMRAYLEGKPYEFRGR